MSTKPNAGLTPAARAALLDRVRSRKSNELPRDEAPSSAGLAAADLPGYSDIAFLRSVQSSLGLELPFYRLHDRMDGAHAMIGGTSRFTNAK